MGALKELYKINNESQTVTCSFSTRHLQFYTKELMNILVIKKTNLVYLSLGELKPNYHPLLNFADI